MPDYFDPTVISRIKGYDIRARRVVEGFLIGMHKSPTLGMSMEFRQHREYVQGDDPRHLDWKVFAKTDKYFIKEYESETNLACQIVLDCSESMSYQGDGAMSKFEYGCTAAASLAYLLLLQRDAVGFTFFDEKVRTYIPSAATFSQFSHAIHTMENITPGAKTMTGDVLSAVGANFKRRSMVIIISDFIDDVEPISLGMNRFHFDGHEVLCLHIADPLEVTFPFSGPSIIEGMEQTGNLRCDPSDYREVYLEARDRHLGELRYMCRRLQYDMSELTTDTPLDEALAEVLLQRQYQR
jgi:uncharacterized protein (DUF58 family)